MIFTFKKAILTLIIFSAANTVFSQTPDTILITPLFKPQAIGTKCFQRMGNQFERFDNAPEKWNRITRAECRLVSDTTNWIYAVLKNESIADRTLKLYLNNVQAGIVKLYTVTDGRIDSTLITGSLVPVNERASSDRVLSFPLHIHSGKVTELYLKHWRRQSVITLTLRLEDPLQTENSRLGDYVLILTLALLLLMVVIALVLYRYISSKENLWFLFYMLPSFFYVLAASGFGSLYVWSAYPWFEENAAIFLANLGSAAFFVFSRNVLRLKEWLPFFNKILYAFSICLAVAGVSGFGLYLNLFTADIFSKAVGILYLFNMLFLVAIFILSIYKAVIKKEYAYFWFVSIFSFYIIFAFVTVALEVGLFTYDLSMKFFLLPFAVLPQMTLILIFLVRRAVKHLKERELKIADIHLQSQQALLNERLRLSRDLHDEVGATLSGIAMYSHLTKEQIKNDQPGEVEKSLNIIQQGAGEMVTKLSDIVWLVNPGQDSLQKLFQRLEEYAVDMASVKNMKIKVSIPFDASTISLPVESRRNIYLLCKEAINNAVKYSDGDLLELAVIQSNDMLKFSVSDNGKGFNTASVTNGNGLENIKKRAEEIHAILDIRSEPGKTTSISVIIKIT